MVQQKFSLVHPFHRQEELTPDAVFFDVLLDQILPLFAERGIQDSADSGDGGGATEVSLTRNGRGSYLCCAMGLTQ